MKTFDFKRFGKVFKWDLANSRHTMVKMFTIWLVVFGFLILSDYMLNTINDTQIRAVSILSSFGIIMFLLLTIVPSLLLVKVNKNKQQRLNYLMLPGTSLEKYLARLIIIFLTYLVTFAMAFVVVDFIQYAVYLIIDPSSANLFISYLFPKETITIVFGEDAASGLCAGTTFILWNLTFYLLGGTFFRKNAWLFVSLILLTIFVLFRIFFGSNHELVNIIHILTRDANTVNTVISIVFGLLTVLNVWLSFWLFKRLQLINNKWINI